MPVGRKRTSINGKSAHLSKNAMMMIDIPAASRASFELRQKKCKIEFSIQSNGEGESELCLILEEIFHLRAGAISHALIGKVMQKSIFV